MKAGVLKLMIVAIALSFSHIAYTASKLVPTASFSVSGTQCQYVAVDFIDGSSASVGTIVLWAWDFDDGSSSNVRNPSHVYSEAGDYDVRLTVVDSNGDVDEFVATVTVEPVATVDFDITSADNCLLTNQTFTSTSSISSGSVTGYEWDYGDGSVSFGEHGSHTYSTTGVFEVEFTAISNLGCRNSITKTVTIYEEPNADFVFTYVCLGEEMNFTNTSSISSGNLSYIWDFGDGNSSTLVNPTHKYASSGDFTVSLTATSSNGCETVTNKNVTVNSNPVSSFDVNPVCFGSNAVFVNNSTGTNLSFQWDFGDGNVSTTFEPTHEYEQPGSYIVNLEVTSDDNCSDIFSKRVDIYNNPSPTFFVADNCLESSVLFNNLTNQAGDTYSYSWDFGDGNSSTSKSPTHTYTISGTYTVELTATTSNNCVSTYSDQVTIWDHPVADFNVTDGCSSVSNAFVNTSTIASGSIASYQWDYGDGSSSKGVTGSHSYANPGVYDVTLTAKSENGCEDEVTKQITVYAKPATNFSYSGACDGNIITFANESSVVEGNLNYTWDFGDGSTSNQINPSHEYASEGVYTVSLEARNNLGGCFTILEKDVEVFQELSSSFSFTSVCYGDEVVFDNTSVGTGVTFNWNFGDGNTSSFFEPSHPYESPGSYIVSLKVTSNDGCVRESESRVDIYSNPTPIFIAENDCADEEILFSNLTDETGVSSYFWDFGDGSTSTQREPIHSYSLNGSYTVSLTVETTNGCQTTVSDEIVIYEIPVADFRVSNVCDGSLSLFENESTGSIKSYLWDFGDLTNSTQQNPSKQFLNPGTYNVTLTVQSTNGCTHSVTKEAVVEAVPIANFTASDVCLGDPSLFTNSSIDDSGTTTFQWDFGDGNTSVARNPSHVYQNSGLFTVSLLAVSSAGCQDLISRQVLVYSPPEISAGKDTTISRGASVQLQAQGAVSYQWSPIAGLSNSNISNPIARPLETTEYVVVGTDQFGCQNTDTVLVTLEEDYRVVANNIFTPDGNGQNDKWIIPNADAFDRVEVRVYDRYGGLVFEDSDYQNDWEGTRGKDILPDGTYYYYITFPGTEVNYSGAITILRNR
ncbi:PKD domain-containing protein [Ekhidna sp.]|uniref:PKD domain-containing protein n=1 Tax=Ekhidna sp. TaxID=2608089 RepID=UPI003511C85F